MRPTATDNHAAMFEHDLPSTPSKALAWTPDLSVNLNYLDRQHLGILGLIDRWWKKIQAGEMDGGVRSLRRIFGYLNRFTQQHLSLEERVLEYLVENSSYSRRECDEHRERHRAFQKDVMARFYDRLAQEHVDPAYPMEYLKPVTRWWVPHIKTLDAAYAAHVAGLAGPQREGLHSHLVESLLQEPIVILSWEEIQGVLSS